jgi:hypothetical protein
LQALPHGCQAETVKDLLPVGRTVLAKVTSIDAEKARFIISLKDSPRAENNPYSELPYLMLNQYLKDIHAYLQRREKSESILSVLTEPIRILSQASR